MPRYTLIAYKPDSIGVCIGNGTETFSSDFQMFHCTSIEELAEHAVKLNQMQYAEQELEHDRHILIDGRPVDLTTDADELELLRLEIAVVAARVEEEKALKTEREALQARIAAEEEEARKQEAQRQQELDTFFALGRKLGFTVAPPDQDAK